MAQHKRKNAQLQAVTANRLRDGEVIYFTAGGDWSESIQEAAVATTPQEAEVLLCRAQKTQGVVEVYVFEVVTQNERIEGMSVREAIRMRGPTVRLDLGKQAGKQAGK